MLPGTDVHTINIDAFIPAGFRLASGERLPQAAVRGRLTGPRHAPTIAVVGGISSGRAAAVTDDGSPGWWPWAVREGGAIDVSRARVLTFDFAPEGLEAPLTLTTHDQARLLVLLLDTLGIAASRHLWVFLWRHGGAGARGGHAAARGAAGHRLGR